MRELVRLADRKESFERLGVRLFAVAIASVEDLAGLQETLGERVTLLADPDGAMVEGFSMIDKQPMPKRRMARAGTFHIDARGMVAGRWLPGQYHQRPDPDAILAALR